MGITEPICASQTLHTAASVQSLCAASVQSLELPAKFLFQALACLTYVADREAEANEAFVQHKRELRTEHTTPARTDGSGATRISTFTLCHTGRSQGALTLGNETALSDTRNRRCTSCIPGCQEP